jgi:hypothetical protein
LVFALQGFVVVKAGLVGEIEELLKLSVSASALGVDLPDLQFPLRQLVPLFAGHVLIESGVVLLRHGGNRRPPCPVVAREKGG